MRHVLFLALALACSTSSPVESEVSAPTVTSEVSVDETARSWCVTSDHDCSDVTCAVSDTDGDGLVLCVATTPAGQVSLDCSLSAGCVEHSAAVPGVTSTPTE